MSGRRLAEVVRMAAGGTVFAICSDLGLGSSNRLRQTLAVDPIYLDSSIRTFCKAALSILLFKIQTPAGAIVTVCFKAAIIIFYLLSKS